MYNVHDELRLTIQMPTQKLTTEILAAALEGFEVQKRRIDEQIAQLRQMLDGGRSEQASETPKRKRKISAAGKRAIAAATKRRWAAFRAAKAAEKPGLAKKGAAKKIAKKRRAAQ
jgi:hypothetical protein